LDFEAFVEAVHLDRFALLGHCAGGEVALAFALKNPKRVEKLVLEDIGPPAAERPHRGSIRAEVSELPLTFSSWEAGAADQRERNSKLSLQRVKSSLPYVFRQLLDGTITWKYDLAGLLQLDPARNLDFNPWRDIQKVGCPMLVVRGSRSRVAPEQAIDAMRAANVGLIGVDIPAAGHKVHLDNVAASNCELPAFLGHCFAFAPAACGWTSQVGPIHRMRPATASASAYRD
jgi:pimeloyl-ACP methyl ester carboxylesterase